MFSRNSSATENPVFSQPTLYHKFKHVTKTILGSYIYFKNQNFHDFCILSHEWFKISYKRYTNTDVEFPAHGDELAELHEFISSSKQPFDVGFL